MSWVHASASAPFLLYMSAVPLLALTQANGATFQGVILIFDSFYPLGLCR